MYLSQSQMLYLVQLCLFTLFEGFNQLKLPSCNKLDKQTCLEPHSKMHLKKKKKVGKDLTPKSKQK